MSQPFARLKFFVVRQRKFFQVFDNRKCAVEHRDLLDLVSDLYGEARIVRLNLIVPAERKVG